MYDVHWNWFSIWDLVIDEKFFYIGNISNVSFLVILLNPELKFML